MGVESIFFHDFLLQIHINESLIKVKSCYDVLIAETESMGIMQGRLDKILTESFI